MADRPWPLHPQPGEWEGLEGYVRRLARLYGVGYDVFLRRALDRRGRGARDLDTASDAILARLSIGTGVPVERLRGMRSWSLVARLAKRGRSFLSTAEGRAAVKMLHPALSRTLRRMDAGGDR